MRQTRAVLKTLKARLKTRGLTYAAVAAHLGLSEPSVKRLFSEGSFSLERLEQVCELASLDLAELFIMHQQQQVTMRSLTREQEAEIAGDIELLLVAVSVMNGMTFEHLLRQYDFDEHTLIRKLAHLDRLRFLELLPGNRIRLLITADFRFRKDGPIQQFFLEQVAQEFFNSRFHKDSEKLLVVNGIISASANHQMQEKMERLAREFAELSEAERSVPLDQRRGNSLVLALRQWQFGLFRERARST